MYVLTLQGNEPSFKAPPNPTTQSSAPKFHPTAQYIAPLVGS